MSQGWVSAGVSRSWNVVPGGGSCAQSCRVRAKGRTSVQRQAGSVPTRWRRSSMRSRPVAVADLEDAVDVDGGWLGRVAGRDQLEAGGELVGPRRRPGLPGLDDVEGLVEVPGEVEIEGVRRGNSAEDERRHHAEAGGAGTTQRPEQVRLVALVAGDDAAVGQHDLGRDHPVGRESVATTEHAEAPAQRQPGDPDGGAGPGGKGTAVRLEAVVDGTQAGAGTDRDQVAVRQDVVHRGDVEHDAGARRVAGEAVATAAYGERQVVLAQERQCRRHVRRRRALDRRPGTDVVEPGVERGRLGVGDDAAVDGRL